MQHELTCSVPAGFAVRLKHVEGVRAAFVHIAVGGYAGGLQVPHIFQRFGIERLAGAYERVGGRQAGVIGGTRTRACTRLSVVRIGIIFARGAKRCEKQALWD